MKIPFLDRVCIGCLDWKGTITSDFLVVERAEGDDGGKGTKMKGMSVCCSEKGVGDKAETGAGKTSSLCEEFLTKTTGV